MAQDIDLTFDEVLRIATASGLGYANAVNLYAALTLGGGGDLTEVESRLDNLEAAPPSSYTVVNAKISHGAVGDGVADDTVAFQAAVAAAGTTGMAVYLPPGEYLLTDQIAIPNGLKIIGDGATIKWNSTSLHLLRLDVGASRVRISGINFEGDVGNMSLLTNQGSAIVMPNGNVDVTISDCIFDSCKPLQAGGSTDIHVGRLLVAGCRFLNIPNSLNLPSNAIVVNSFWWVDPVGIESILLSHGIYVFGEAENVVISNCIFENVTGDAIKFNVGTSLYEQKRNCLISGNTIINNRSYGIWLGSDRQGIVGGFNVVNNTFRNCSELIHVHNCSDTVVANNIGWYDWRVVLRGTTTAISVSGAGMAFNIASQSEGVAVHDNRLRLLHPYVGVLSLTGTPNAGGTVTVGAQTYTWVDDLPNAAGEVMRRNYTDLGEAGTNLEPRFAAENLMHAIRGNAWNVPNLVLRTNEDCFYEGTTTTGQVVVASDATFTLSEVTDNMTASTITNNTVVTQQSILVRETKYAKVYNNFCEWLGPIALINCVDPEVYLNTVVENGVTLTGCVREKVWGNNPERRLTRLPTRGRNAQRIVIKGGFSCIYDNGLVRPQEFMNPEQCGASGIVPVSDGYARQYLYYGPTLTFNEYGSAQIPYNWQDGDTVVLGTPAAVEYTFTYKRESPGAGQFNSAATLRTLIDAAAGGWTTSFAPYVNLGTSVDPELMIVIKYDTIGDTGNSCYIRVNTRSELCGQVLRNTDATDANEYLYPYFQGGDSGGANADRTFCWTPMACTGVPPHVQGVDAASQALNPVVYPANIVPGIGFWITHNAAGGAGTEKFAWSYKPL